MKFFRIWAVSLSLVAAPAAADSLSAGKKAYVEKDYAKAIAKWRESDTWEAAFGIAYLAEAGLVPDCDKINCAGNWYRTSADRGSVDAMLQLGRLNINNGFRDVGVTWYTLAARWNNENAREILGQMGQPIPEPDLYIAEVERQRASDEQRAFAQQQAQQNLLGILSLGAAIYGAKGAASAQLPPRNTYNRDHGTASLSSQESVGYQRQCGYITPSGRVTVIVSGSCPPTYQY